MNRQLACLVLSAGLGIVSTASASTIVDLSFLPQDTPATIDEAIILSTTDLAADPGVRSFQIRDNTRAITIYGTNAEIGGRTARRDGVLVLVTGTVGGFAVTGRTTLLPLVTGALSVSPSDIAESHESQLVCLQNVSFADSGTSGTLAAESNYALAGGSAFVRIATADLGLAGQPIPSGPLNITGIVIHSDAGYCLAPRGPEDIVPVPEPATLALLALGGAGILMRRRGLRMNRRLACLVLSAGLGLVSTASADTMTIAQIAALPEGGHATSDAVVILSTTDLVANSGFKSFQVRDNTRAAPETSSPSPSLPPSPSWASPPALCSVIGATEAGHEQAPTNVGTLELVMDDPAGWSNPRED